MLLLVGGLAFGGSQLSAHNRQVMAISEQQQNFVPNVRVDAVRASDSTMVCEPASHDLGIRRSEHLRAS